MHSKIAALILLTATAFSGAQAAPAQDDMDKLLAQKGLAARIGESIGQVTDRTAEIVMNAMGSLGVPYRMGGTSAETGFDCSGFVRAMYQQTVGLMLPRRAEEQAASTARIDRDELKPGDLVFFNTLRRAYSHVGIYVGDGKFVHAPRTGAHVRVESMNVSYWQTRFNGARRVLASESVASGNGYGSDRSSGSSRVIDRESPAPTTIRLGGFGRSSEQPARASTATSRSDDQNI